MLRSILALALCVGACAPTPPSLPATQASEMLARFAAGAGPADICTVDGRLLLRGAVRAYGAAMTEAGETWPSLPTAEDDSPELDSVEIAVLIAVAAGYVRASDLPQPARNTVRAVSLINLSAVNQMHDVAEQACGEVVDLQQAVGRYFQEMSRLERLNARDERDGDRVRRQVRRVERAMTHMNDMAARLEARVAEIHSEEA